VYVFEHRGALGEDRFDSVDPFPATPNTLRSGGTPVGVGITNVNTNQQRELTIAANVAGGGGSVGVFEATSDGSNHVSQIITQQVAQAMQVFAVGDADNNHNGVPDQAIFLYAQPQPSPTPTV